MRLPTLASELGPHTALRLAAVRLLRRGRLMGWASATMVAVTDRLLLAGYLAGAAWLGIIPWVRGTLILLVASFAAWAVWRRL